MDPKEFADARIKSVERLVKTLGYTRINLIHYTAETRSEGMWAVAASPEDEAKLASDDSTDEAARVYLCNHPFWWGGRCWGAEIICMTRGKRRAAARLVDQTPLDGEVETLYRGLKMIERGAVK